MPQLNCHHESFGNFYILLLVWPLNGFHDGSVKHTVKLLNMKSVTRGRQNDFFLRSRFYNENSSSYPTYMNVLISLGFFWHHARVTGDRITEMKSHQTQYTCFISRLVGILFYISNKNPHRYKQKIKTIISIHSKH